MATIIPRVQAPSTEVQGIPSVRNTAQVDMSPAIRGVQQLGAIANDYFQQAKDRADLTAIMQARRELSDWEGETFNPANENGIKQFQGKEALRANEVLLPDLDQRISNIRGRLTRDQQARFDGIADNFRSGVNERLNGYADREYQTYERAEQKAALDNIGQDAIAAGVAGDYGRQTALATEAIMMARQAYTTQGFGEEAIKASERGIVSGIHKGTIEGMMTREPLAAEAYFSRYADQMSPEDRAATERMLLPYVEDRVAIDDVRVAKEGGEPAFADVRPRGKPSAEVASAIDQAAKEAGLDAAGRADLYALAEQESGFNAGAVNPEALDDGDHATGLFQYRQTTSAELGNFDRRDALASARAAAKQYADRRARGGRDFAIAAHFAGEGGADAVVNRGRTAENPKTALYVRQVDGRAARWRKESGETIRVAGAAASPAEVLERIGTIADPRRRAAAERRFKDELEIAKYRQQEADKQTGLAIYEKVTQADAGTPLSQILSPAEMALVGRESGLSESINRFRKLQASGQVIEDDPATLDRLYRMQATNPNEFAKLKIADYGDRLSGQTMKELAAAQREAGKANKAADWASDEDRINGQLSALGLGREGDARGAGSDKKNEPRDRQRGEFRIAYNSAVRTFVQQSGGKKPTPEQADVLARTVAKQFAVRMSAGTSGIYSSGATFDLQVSEADRAAVAAAYRAKYGTTPTDAWITRYITTKRGSAQ